MKELTTPVLVMGGGLGGVAAALAVAELGMSCILTEEGEWLGGQLTSQAVPQDDNPWIDGGLTSNSYRALRERIRGYYQRNYPLAPGVDADTLNPGLAFVGPICHEPRVAESAIGELLSPHVAGGRITILKHRRPIAAQTSGDRVDAVTFEDVRTGSRTTVSPTFIIDSTELGDLLALAGIEHVIGAESRDDTGELHATEEANVADQQATTWCFAVDYRPGEDHTIDRPEGYARWRDLHPAIWPDRLFSWTDVNPVNLKTRQRMLFEGDTDEARLYDWWHFRRILARQQFDRAIIPFDISLINQPQIDYTDRPLLRPDSTVDPLAKVEALEQSKSYLYWLQTEAPRPDGGTGYPGLNPRGDALGTEDGFAKDLYVREGRRLEARFRILEQHIGYEARGDGRGAELFDDTVGIGFYRIDLHPSTSGRSYVDLNCFPFQVPLGALLPKRVENVIAGGKNIGTTHVTNGAYRLHPVEWVIGEAAGALAAFCLQRGTAPAGVVEGSDRLREFQGMLSSALGVPLQWPEDMRYAPYPFPRPEEG